MKKIIAFILFGSMLITGMNAQKKEIKLWKGKIPGSIENQSYREDTTFTNGKAPRIGHVTDPTLTIYPAPTNIANHTAVIICPGGGYARLAMDHEGYDIAAWFNKMGVTVILLKYRLPSDLIMEDKSIGPLQDAQEAIRTARRNAKAWNIDPRKIGIIGFSAGGHLASTASTHFNDKVYESDTTSARPDFSLLIYPVISMDPAITHGGSRQNLIGKNPTEELQKRFSNELQVTSNTPPTFMVHATDDGTVPVLNSINYYLSLKNNKVPAELHLYEKGGHGFGMGRTNGTESTWTLACQKWMQVHGLL